MNTSEIEAALRGVGELLEADGAEVAIVIIGGAALHLLGVVDRTTRDVDIVAVGVEGDAIALQRPLTTLPPALERAASSVARDYGLPTNWLNTGPAGQWDVGFPPGFVERLAWRTYGGLRVGVANSEDLVVFKLEAAAEQPNAANRHFQDLVALRPSAEQLQKAVAWLRQKNVGLQDALEQVSAHVIRIISEEENRSA